MCSVVVPIVLGVAQAGLGIMQAQAQEQAAREQVMFANQQAEQQFQYDQLQTDAARTAELQREAQREEEIRRNTELAQITRANEIAAINTRFAQEQEAASQKQQEQGKRALEAAGQIRAQGRIGANVDLLLADVRRQQASFDYYSSRNLAFIGDELQARKQVVQGNYANAIANQTPYQKKMILDPLEPMKRSMPSSAPYRLAAFGSVLSGISGGVNMYTSGAGKGKDGGNFRMTSTGGLFVGGKSNSGNTRRTSQRTAPIAENQVAPRRCQRQPAYRAVVAASSMQVAQLQAKSRSTSKTFSFRRTGQTQSQQASATCSGLRHR